LFTDIYAQILPPSFPIQQIGNPIVTNQEVGMEVTTFYEGFDDHRLRLSGGGSYVDVDTKQYKNWGQCVDVQFGPLVDVSDTPCVFLEPNTRNLWYLSLQDEWTFARNWELTAGVRYDHYSDFGGTTNPRLALVWETRPDLTTKLLYGRAFRAPSFAELYAQNNVSATGNPDLAPEEIDSLELVFDYWPVQKLRTTLNLFTYRAENLIEFVPPSPQVAENLGKQDGHGFEFELDWLALDSLRIRSNFALQRSKNKKLDATVPDAPEMQFYLNPHWTFLPDWSLDGQLFWVGKRHRHPDDPREDIDDYTTVNLNVRRKYIAKHWDIAIGVRNLFDAVIREPSPYDATAPLGAHIPYDYPMEGRSIWGELRYTF
jgi:iron complex outermembrane receptor protein